METKKVQLKQQLTAAVELFIDSLFDRVESELKQKTNPNDGIKERHMSAKEVRAYYGGISDATLRRHEEKGLRRMPSRKNCNRLFKFSECERYFNQKK